MPPTYSKKNGYDRKGNQRFKPDEKKYLYNIDTLWLNANCYFYNEVMENGFRDILIEGRSAINDGSDVQYIELKLDGYEEKIVFEILGGNPPLYQYSIRNDSYAFYFSKSKREKQSPMRIQINQFVLWEKGVEGAYIEALDVLKSIGFVPYEIKLNRIDFAVHSDQFTWNYSDMTSFDYPKNFAGDNHPNFYKLNPSTGDFGTFMVGDRSRLAIRIYNKSKEIQDKKKYYFFELYERKGMNIANVWNIEIEVRRPFLKDLMDANSEYERLFDDFDYCLKNNGLSRLWSLLLDKYSHDSVHWKMLSKLKDNHFLYHEKHGLTVFKDIDSTTDREVAQIAGRLQMFVLNEDDASIGHAISKFIDMYNTQEKSKEKTKKRTWEEKVNLKKRKIHSHEIHETLIKKKKETSINSEVSVNKEI